MVEFEDTLSMVLKTQKSKSKACLDIAEDLFLRVQSYWEPIQDATYNLHNRSPRHIELFDLKPAQFIREYGVDDFKGFLPMAAVTVGDVWALDQSRILSFLDQFHPGATTSLHHGTGQEGAFACLRALSSYYAEIVFRIHAEFKLDEPKAYFTPAQFVGRLTINRKKGALSKFFLNLPPRNSNVAIKAFGQADMVFVPHMALISNVTDNRQKVEWETTITEKEARKSLALKFYKFAEIEWTPIEEAVERAQVEDRPIHAIILFGTLDDESC